MDYTKELDFARQMALEAGRIMKKYYRADQQVETKPDQTPVTIADKEINDMLIEHVKKEYPDCGVLGEEMSWQSNRQKLWVCDPIDGTVGYILHVPTSMFSLALVDSGQPMAAVAYNPWTDEFYQALKNKGSLRNNVPIYVSKRKWGEKTQLAGASGGMGEPANKFGQKLIKKDIHVTAFVGTVFKGCLVAEGSIDGRTFMHHSAHDIAALKLIIEEAGGKVTDLDGNEQRYDRQINGAVMSNGVIHDELLKLVKKNK